MRNRDAIDLPASSLRLLIQLADQRQVEMRFINIYNK